MSVGWKQRFQNALVELEEADRLRKRCVHSDASIVDFGSNDYLGLRCHSTIRENIADWCRGDGTAWGSGASPVLSGYTPAHAKLERSLCELSHSTSAMVFSSGYSANLGSLACIAGASDAIYSDQFNHASLIDGMRLSRAEKVIFPHNDLGFLEEHLASHRHRFERVLIVTESVFSMDGDCADLLQLCELSQRFDCGLVVDEAHATGVYGVDGGGLLEELELDGTQLEPLVLKLGTLSKAIGGIGGFAAGDGPTIDYLVNRCRSFLFSTSPPALMMHAVVAAIELLRSMRAERQELRSMSFSLRQRLQRAGFEVAEGDSPIVPVVLGSERDAIEMSQRLLTRGLYVPAIRPPTVPAGASRLRISLSAKHTAEEVDQLFDALSF